MTNCNVYNATFLIRVVLPSSSKSDEHKSQADDMNKHFENAADIFIRNPYYTHFYITS